MEFDHIVDAEIVRTASARMMRLGILKQGSPGTLKIRSCSNRLCGNALGITRTGHCRARIAIGRR